MVVTAHLPRDSQDRYASHQCKTDPCEMYGSLYPMYHSLHPDNDAITEEDDMARKSWWQDSSSRVKAWIGT
jgi:hypothetical protein